MAPRSTAVAARVQRHRLGVLLLAAALVGPACSTGSGTPGTTTGPTTTTPVTPTTRPQAPVPTYLDANGFDDHTVPLVASVAEFFALARPGVSGQSAVKFTISDMAAEPQISWMDSNFYSLHDEWYWFRLLNGAAVRGAATAPVAGRRFETIQQIYEWAAAQPPLALPLNLTFVGAQGAGTRLYSDEFYDLSLHDPRTLGPGTVAYFPTSTTGEARWVLELEFHDMPEPEEVALFFEMAASSLPAEIGANLEWVVRSPEQATVAATMAAAALPFHDSTITYSELVEPGTVAVYNEGIAAGRLLLIEKAARTSATPATTTFCWSRTFPTSCLPAAP